PSIRLHPSPFLPSPGDSSADTDRTASISRDHTILVSSSGLLTITGGKWTTYRRMAQEAVDRAEVIAGFERRPCKTERLQVHGTTTEPYGMSSLQAYGSDAAEIASLIQREPALGARLHPDLPYVEAEVIWAVRSEMAQTVEDVLARRTRALILNARASILAAPRVAELMAQELRLTPEWKTTAVETYRRVAERYLLS
ncbi:MAG: FAD-dependent oxidoreductase, partial [Verrucomicrobiaceae bacterium]